jgi:hypothetical protein
MLRKELPIISAPCWLSNLSPGNFNQPLPVTEILRDSLYYPSSAFDGDPIKHLAGNFRSFIYVDYGYTQDQLMKALESPGFKGYAPLAIRSVTQPELLPKGHFLGSLDTDHVPRQGKLLIESRFPYFTGDALRADRIRTRRKSPAKVWAPMMLRDLDGDPNKYRDGGWIKEPFCVWAVFQRGDNLSSDYGPHRFSLLYFCADGVPTFQALYLSNKAAPKAIAVIQSGSGFGMNWTDFRDPGQILGRSVLGNPFGQPELLLYGGYGRRASYRPPCWPGYQSLICFVNKLDKGNIGVWSRSTRPSEPPQLEDGGMNLP